MASIFNSPGMSQPNSPDSSSVFAPAGPISPRAGRVPSASVGGLPQPRTPGQLAAGAFGSPVNQVLQPEGSIFGGPPAQLVQPGFVQQQEQPVGPATPSQAPQAEHAASGHRDLFITSKHPTAATVRGTPGDREMAIHQKKEEFIGTFRGLKYSDMGRLIRSLMDLNKANRKMEIFFLRLPANAVAEADVTFDGTNPQKYSFTKKDVAIANELYDIAFKNIYYMFRYHRSRVSTKTGNKEVDRQVRLSTLSSNFNPVPIPEESPLIGWLRSENFNGVGSININQKNVSIRTLIDDHLTNTRSQFLLQEQWKGGSHYWMCAQTLENLIELANVRGKVPLSTRVGIPANDTEGLKRVLVQYPQFKAKVFFEATGAMTDMYNTQALRGVALKGKAVRVMEVDGYQAPVIDKESTTLPNDISLAALSGYTSVGIEQVEAVKDETLGNVMALRSKLSDLIDGRPSVPFDPRFHAMSEKKTLVSLNTYNKTELEGYFKGPYADAYSKTTGESCSRKGTYEQFLNRDEALNQRLRDFAENIYALKQGVKASNPREAASLNRMAGVV